MTLAPALTRTQLYRSFAQAARDAAADGRHSERVEWPSVRYAADPAAFALEILGVRLWPKQVQILEALRKPQARVTVRSGHKCGKSMVAAIAALWFYCSFEEARVVLSSTTARQVDAILWHEVKRRIKYAKRKIDGELHELARSGLKSLEGFREIVGFTAREAEAVAGISGKNLLYLVDEASGVPDAIFEAIEGNRAGGARIGLFSNPTRTEGEFFRSHCDDDAKKLWTAIHMSSTEAASHKIEGLAVSSWLEEKREEWGETSPMYKVRALGEFVLGEDGKILTLHAIGEAEKRWADTPAIGRLHVGIDPAGPGEGGDESVFAVRRGAKILALYPFRALSEEAHIAHLLGILIQHKQPRELAPPIVTVDREGPIGSRVCGLLRAAADGSAGAFEVVGVRSSDRAMREPRTYDRTRDELWANLAQWIREGGAIPEDAKLERELHAPEWQGQLTGRLKVTDKRELRKDLGRSPDRADAVALAVWETAAMAPDNGGTGAEPEDDFHEVGPVDQTFDPYAGR